MKIMKLSDVGEIGFLAAIRRYTGENAFVELGFGDDGAILKSGGRQGRFVVTTDLLVEETHFSLKFYRAFDLGEKAYEVNASDLAAMGAWPVASFLSIGAAPGLPLEFLTDFYKGFQRAGRRHGCVIAGGDTVRATKLIISVMMIGRYEKGSHPLLRSDARPAEHIYVTGWPGESGMGLWLLKKQRGTALMKKMQPLIRRHLLPKARVREGVALSHSRSTGAAIDVSDGLFSELNHIARMSRVHLCVEWEKLPVSLRLEKGCRPFGLDPRRMVLFGGEDYELLFTNALPLCDVEALFKKAGSRIPVHEIGHVEKGSGVKITDHEGRTLSLKDRTYQHFSTR